MFMPSLERLETVEDIAISEYFNDDTIAADLKKWADQSVYPQLGAGLEQLFSVSGDPNVAAGVFSYLDSSHRLFHAFRTRVLAILGQDDGDVPATQFYEIAIGRAYLELIRGPAGFDLRNLGTASQCRFIAGYYLPDIVARKSRYVRKQTDTRAINLLGLHRVEKGLVFRAFRSALLLSKGEADTAPDMLAAVLDKRESDIIEAVKLKWTDLDVLWPLAIMKADAFVQVFERVGSAMHPGVFSQLACCLACYSGMPSSGSEDFIREYMKIFNQRAAVMDFSTCPPDFRLRLLFDIARGLASKGE